MTSRHARADNVAVGLDAGLQEIRNIVLAPVADAMHRVAADIGGGEAVGSADPIAGEPPELVAAAEPVARRVAFAAMRHGLDEIPAAVPLRAAGRIGSQRARPEIPAAPQPKERARPNGKAASCGRLARDTAGMVER